MAQFHSIALPQKEGKCFAFLMDIDLIILDQFFVLQFVLFLGFVFKITPRFWILRAEISPLLLRKAFLPMMVSGKIL
ncbi:MAG TPA: hypothetical protein DD803_16125 [Alcaligenes faecalis]|nr:hypothetical protein [Alcaligenes faecalis]